MGMYEFLAQAGYKPKGTAEPSGFQKALSSIGDFAVKMQEKKEKDFKTQKDKFDMFKTLRDAGYTKQEAYDAILKGTGIPAPSGEKTIEERKEEAELESTKALTEYRKASTADIGEDSKFKQQELDLRSKGQTLESRRLDIEVDKLKANAKIKGKPPTYIDAMKLAEKIYPASGSSSSKKGIERVNRIKIAAQHIYEKAMQEYGTPHFTSEAEVEEAGLKDGQEIYINGRRAVYHKED